MTRSRVHLNPASTHITKDGKSSTGPIITVNIGSVTDGAMVVVISMLTNDNAGVLDARIVIQGVPSEVSPVALVVAKIPVVAPNPLARFAKSSSGNRIEVTGTHFGTIGGDLSFVFTPALGDVSVVTCNDSFVVVDVADSSNAAAGDLTLTVSHSDYGASIASKVGLITKDMLSKPEITLSSATVDSHVQSLRIKGNHFGTAIGSIKVYVTPAGGTAITAYVDSSLGQFSDTSMTVRLIGLSDLNAGSLLAVIAVKGIMSSAVQVASVQAVSPVVLDTNALKMRHSSTGNMIEILGLRFGTDKADLTLMFTPALPGAKLLDVSNTKLVVSTGDTSTVTSGHLKVIVTHVTRGSSHFGAPQLIGSVELNTTAVYVTNSDTILPSTGGTVAITGAGFGTIADSIRVYLMNLENQFLSASGPLTAGISGSITDGGFTISVVGLTHASAGPLYAKVVVDGIPSTITQIAMVAVLTPVIKSTPTQRIQQHASDAVRIMILGEHFHSTKGDINSVVFTPALSTGAVSVFSCNDTVLIVDVPNTDSTISGDLIAAVVTHNTYGASQMVTIGEVVPGTDQPTVMVNSAVIGSNVTSLEITGTHFRSSHGDVKVYFTTVSSGTIVIGTVHSNGFSSSSFSVSLNGLTDRNIGMLSVVVTVDARRSVSTQVATVAAIAPIITQTDFNIAQSASGCHVEITGSRFGVDPTALSVLMSDTSPTISGNVPIYGQWYHKWNIVALSDTIILVKINTDTRTAILGDLKVVVKHKYHGCSHFGCSDPAGKVKVANIVAGIMAPFVQPSRAKIPSYAGTGNPLSIRGNNFGSAVNDVRVYLTTKLGAYLNPSQYHITNHGVREDSTTSDSIKTVVSSAGFSATHFQIHITGTTNTNEGMLYARVMVAGIESSLTQVAYIKPVSAEIHGINGLKISTSQSKPTRIHIPGRNFTHHTSNPAELVIEFTPSLGSVTIVSLNDTLIVADVPAVNVADGVLLARLSHPAVHGALTGDPTPVAMMITNGQPIPTVRTKTNVHASNNPVLKIDGANFGTDISQIRVYMTVAGGNFVHASILPSTYTETNFNVHLEGLNDLHVGSLQVIVSVNGVKSALTQIATVEAVMPTVTAGAYKIMQSSKGNLVEIVGSRFGTDKRQVHVQFKPFLGNEATVVVCTDSTLIVSVSDTSVVPVGPLKAVVSTSYGSSGFGNVDPVGEVVIGEVLAAVVGTMEPLISISDYAISSGDSNIQIFADHIGSLAAEIRVHLVGDKGYYNIITPLTQFIQPSRLVFEMPAGNFLQKKATSALQAVVTRYGLRSEKALVGDLTHSAYITKKVTLMKENNFMMAKSVLGNRIELRGQGFGTDPTQVMVTFTPTLTIAGIHHCSDGLLVVDTANSVDALSGTTKLAASVTKTTPTRVLSTPVVTVATILPQMDAIPLIQASHQQVARHSTGVAISGVNFGFDAGEIRVYLATTTGPLVEDIQIDTTNSTSMHISHNASRKVSQAGSMLARVSVRGVLSNSAIIAMIADGEPVLNGDGGGMYESPVEGNVNITLKGANLRRTGESVAYCKWVGIGITTVGTLAGDGTSATCTTPTTKSGKKSQLTLIIPEESGVYPQTTFTTTGVTLTYFTTFLLSDLATNSVLRFKAETGAYMGQFVETGSGGLDMPWGLAFGPANNLYVASANTDSVLLYHGTTGSYVRHFCNVKSPRGLTFHYQDLYVTSSLNAKVYRFNGETGSQRGLLASTPLLQDVWSLVFDPFTNSSFVASQKHHHVLKIAPPKSFDSWAKQTDDALSEAGIWSNKAMHHMTGLDLSPTHLYAVSPYASAVMQYNRTSGAWVNRFGDADNFIAEAFDTKYFDSSLYVCGAEGVQRFREVPGHILDNVGQGLWLKHEGLRCSFFLVHEDALDEAI